MDNHVSHHATGRDLSVTSPDKYSRSGAEAGNRVVQVIRGWLGGACLLAVAGLLVGNVGAQTPSAQSSARAGRRDVMSDARAVAVAYIDAVGRQQFERVSELLHPNVEFRMPGREIHGSQAYIASLQKLGPVLLRNEIKATIVEGRDVCVIYDFVTDTTVGAVPSVEWLTIEDGRIRSVWLLFHSQPWPIVLEELARRAKLNR